MDDNSIPGFSQSKDSHVVLVTGAGGLIGRAVIYRLLQLNKTIRGWFGPGDELHSSDHVEVIQGSILNERLAKQALRGVTTVIHLAGPPSARESLASASMTVSAHTLGTAILLEAIGDLAPQTIFVYASSAAVYGRPISSPVQESAPKNPRSPYAAAKIGAEALIRSYCWSAGLKAAILRPFSVYGPGMNPTSVVAEILAQATDLGRPEILVRDAHTVCDFTHVIDVAEAFSKAASYSFASGEHKTWNVGSGVPTSIGQLAQCMIDLCGRKLPIVETDKAGKTNASSGFSLVADTDRVVSELEWSPSISLKNGLHDFLRSPAGRLPTSGCQQ